MTFIRRFAGDNTGATAIEYALIAAGVALVIIAAVQSLGTTINSSFTDAAAGL